jgi:glycogen(starch) synthase
MECSAMGVPAVTTDLSGFGAYVQRNIVEHNDQGIYVLNRRTQGFDQATDELTDFLLKFVQLNRRQRIEMRNKVERLSEKFDWSVLSRRYDEAHQLALTRGSEHRAGAIDVRVV